MAEFEIAVTRRGARMVVRVDAHDETEARGMIRRALGDAVEFECGQGESAAARPAATGLPFVMRASAAGMAAVLLHRLAAAAADERRVLVSAG